MFSNKLTKCQTAVAKQEVASNKSAICIICELLLRYLSNGPSVDNSSTIPIDGAIVTPYNLIKSK